MLMKVERPNLGVSPKFQRLYISLGAMKKGFLDRCRLVIGVDGFFFKWSFNGPALGCSW
jgi:hypothetical protein